MQVQHLAEAFTLKVIENQELNLFNPSFTIAQFRIILGVAFIVRTM